MRERKERKKRERENCVLYVNKLREREGWREEEREIQLHLLPALKMSEYIMVGEHWFR